MFNRGLAFYEANFFSGWNGEKVCGEKTPEYLLVPDAAARIASSLGQKTKLIALLRNPAERAHSGWRHSLMLGRETLPFQEALDAEPARLRANVGAARAFGYIERGLYAKHLRRYTHHFPVSNIHICFFEDFVENQDISLQFICEFLGVTSEITTDVANVGRPKLNHIEVDRSKNTINMFGNVVRQPSRFLQDHARRYNETLATMKSLSAMEAIEINQRYFYDDIRWLEGFAGRNLAHWLGEPG
jgi:hypothetical protein